MVAAVFGICVTIIIAGWLWFFVVRPILVDYGVIRDQETVNPSQGVMSPAAMLNMADEADRPADRLADHAPESRLSEKKEHPPRLQLDKTRTAVIEELLTNDWTIADLRREGILRGDNKTIGDEVAEARKRLGLVDAERTLRVRDASGERIISFDPDPRFRDLDQDSRPILR